ncbi:MAG: ABC transporter substrate-binding protein [Fimbriimonadaceae bacterium]|nr:ABC transporter substrate-binding protein [Fimbriimonadaceae bacterium]
MTTALPARRGLRLGLLLATLGSQLGGCRHAPSPATPPASAPVAAVRKLPLRHAEGFQVTFHAGWKELTLLRSWRGDGVAETWWLVPHGATPPPSAIADHTIRVPVRRAVMMSTTYLPTLVELGQLDTLVGISGQQYLTTPAVRQRYDAGQVADLGEGAEVNLERLVALQPDLVMTFDMGDPQYDHGGKLREAGLPVVFNADHLENTPLGRAEWLKFIAAFYNAEDQAATWFDRLERDYQQLRERTAQVRRRPLVLCGSAFSGTWYIPGGGNWSAVYLADAGARYAWADNPSTEALQLGFEAVLARAAAADWWLHPAAEPTTLARLLAQDSRLERFAAVRAGRVANNSRRMRAGGGNAYHEQGVVEPQVILADLVRLLHPELLPQHRLVYYEPVPRGAAQ